MSKERLSVTVDPEIKEQVERESVNASGLVNRLLSNHFTGGDGERSMLQLRLEQLNTEIDSLTNELEQKRKERDRVKERLNEHQSEQEDIIDEAAIVLSDAPLTTDNPAVQQWADKASITSEELIERLQQRR